MIFSGESLSRALEKEFSEANSSINIISAFVTFNASNMLVEYTSDKNLDRNVVGRFVPSDFLSGASSLDALRLLIKDGVKVCSLKNLHAKIYQIDTTTIFAGSANFTNNGLCLVGEGNLEATFRIDFSDEVNSFIAKIISASNLIELSTLERMEEFLSQIDETENVDNYFDWPEDVMPKITELFVSDFPLSPPGEVHKSYESNPMLEFAQIESLSSDTSKAATLFKSSKAYQWLKKVINNNDNERDLSFGAISQKLHKVLCDDPAPYRRDIKSIQVNLYAYVKMYAQDEMEIYVPGRRSEVIRLID